MPRIRRILTGLCSNAIEILFAANEDAPIGNCGRGVNRLANRVRAENFMFWTGLHDERVAVFARHQNLAFERDWRGREGCGNRDSTALVFHFASLRVETRENAAVSGQVEIVAVQERRWHVRSSFRIRPGHVCSASKITALAEFNRHRDLCREASDEKYHLVVRNRRRNRIALDALVPPKLFAGRWIVTNNGLSSARD